MISITRVAGAGPGVLGEAAALPAAAALVPLVAFVPSAAAADTGLAETIFARGCKVLITGWGRSTGWAVGVLSNGRGPSEAGMLMTLGAALSAVPASDDGGGPAGLPAGLASAGRKIEAPTGPKPLGGLKLGGTAEPLVPPGAPEG